MSTRAKLTDDIVFYILNRATTDISNGLQQWKKSLYVLAVCRQWRALGKFILYSWGFVGGKSKPYKLADVPTNLELTHAIGSSVYVKTIIITHKDTYSAQELLLCVRDALSLRQPPWFNIKCIRITSHFASHALSTRTLVDSEAAYIDNVVQTVQKAIPKLQVLDISAIRTDAAICRFSTQLVHNYIAQLNHFIYTGFPFKSTLCHAQQLKTLYLYLTKAQPSPNIIFNPTRIKSMCLNNVSASYRWDNFAHTQGQLVFNDLEHLTLACTGLGAQLISTGAAHNIHPIPTPSFPRITRLTLSGICIEQSLLERMLRPPLKCLEISWWLFDFKRLNILDLRFLDTLKIWHNLNSDSNDINFFDTTNSIFSMAKGVRLVQLSLYTVPESIQWKHAQWSHLTRLHLDLTTTLYYLFNMVPMFTGLWELKIGRLRMPTEEECADPDTYLPDLKLKMRPSASKIKNLLIEFRPQFSPEYTNKVVAMLRWYMPMLVLVSIPSD